MPTQIQLRRGTTAEHSSFTGAAGEVTVDTTKKTLVVHDGSTAGGIPMAKENNATLAGNVTVSGGTANGVAYLNGSKVLTSGSALTYDGTVVTASSSTSATGNFKTTSNTAQVYNLTASNDANTTIGLGVFGSAAGSFGTLSAGTPFLATSAATMVQNVQNASGAFVWGIGSTPTEQMRLTSTGLGIGTNSPVCKLNVRGAGDQVRYEVATATDARHEYFRNGSREAYINWDANLFTIAATQASGVLTFAAGGTTERVRITSSGDLLVGTQSSDGSRLRVYGSYQTLGDGAYEGLIGKASSLVSGGGSGDFAIRSAANLVFATNGNAERARITSGGTLVVGNTAAASFEVLCASLNSAGTAPFASWNRATSGDNYFAGWFTEGTATIRGSIDYNRAGGLVRYNTTSDYRAKDIIGPVQNPGATIDALKVYEGKMKDATQSRPMLVAHEAQAVVPYAVTGEKDAVNEDGTPKFQQMDVSSLVPLLLAEIQSLRARVAQLEQGA